MGSHRARFSAVSVISSSRENQGCFKQVTVVMVTSDVMKMTTTCSALGGHLFDIIIIAATDKDF